MQIANNILRHYLKNCYFINGTAYAGKSTMCRMLSERYGMLLCGENYGLDELKGIVSQEEQPNLNYFNTMKSWREFVTRTPDEYESWIEGNCRELISFEVAQLIRVSADRKVIVDTNIPCDVLMQLSDYNRVAVMVSPQSMSVERFFDRDDPEKLFLLSELDKCPDPESAKANYRECIARINSREHYDEFVNSGFYVIERKDSASDTREETLAMLAEHFGLK